MDSTLDFVTRARRAFQEFRHPTEGAVSGDPNAPGYAGDEHDAEEANLHAVLQPKITAVENQARLAEFRLLVGITQDKSFTGHFGFQHNRRPQASLKSRPAPNMGIYTTVCDAEIKAKRNFKGASRLISICLGLQIIVAAALTALGAANGSRGGITALGSINTVIAALMSYLKGSGLPNRLKYFQHEWHKVREYIEQRERDFYLGLPGLDVHEEVEKIRSMFEGVRADIESNTPDRFVSAGQMRPQNMTNSTARPVIARPQPSYSTDSVRRVWNEKELEAQGVAHKAQDTAHGMFSNLSHLKDVMQDRMKDVGRMQQEMEANGRRMADEKKRDLEKGIQSTVQEVGQLGSDIEHNARTAVAQQIADRSQQADDAIAHSYDATRLGLAHQRDSLNAALSDERYRGHEGHEGPAPPGSRD